MRERNPQSPICLCPWGVWGTQLHSAYFHGRKIWAFKSSKESLTRTNGWKLNPGKFVLGKRGVQFFKAEANGPQLLKAGIGLPLPMPSDKCGIPFWMASLGQTQFVRHYWCGWTWPVKELRPLCGTAHLLRQDMGLFFFFLKEIDCVIPLLTFELPGLKGLIVSLWQRNNFECWSCKHTGVSRMNYQKLSGYE